MELLLKNPIILVTLLNLNILLLKKHSKYQKTIDYIYIFFLELLICSLILFFLKLL